MSISVTANTFDTIDRDVFQHQLLGVVEEMSKTLRRSAYSSVIWDMYDYACAIFSPEGEMLAQSNTIPAQLGTMSTALSHLVREIPLAQWAPGDVLVCNDPYRGCTHTMDITLFSPVYHAGELIAVTSTIAHHIDIGGSVPCSTSVEIAEVYGEGLIFPPSRLIRQGVADPVVEAFVRSNVRDPVACMGDLRAQVAGCRTAEARLAEIAGKYGLAAFRSLCALTLDYGERYVRGVIAGLADGTYSGEVLIEDGIAQQDWIYIRADVTISGESIAVDFSRSSSQRPFALNCPWSSTVSLATYALKCLTSPDLPQNGGCNRPISLSAPLGSILNPERPAAVGYRHFLAQSVADAILRALSPLFRDRDAAGCQISFPLLLMGGRDDRPHVTAAAGRAVPYQIMDTIGGGMGGSATGDGISAVDVHGSNCAILSAEVMETVCPIRVLRSALVPGSGGDGAHRGGLSIERDYELLSERTVVACNLQQTQAESAPWGALGGSKGGTARAILNPGMADERVMPARFPAQSLARGQVIRLRAAGGGGYGKPDARDPAARQRDRQLGYV